VLADPRPARRVHHRPSLISTPAAEAAARLRYFTDVSSDELTDRVRAVIADMFRSGNG
jgi:hypothetical protein